MNCSLSVLEDQKLARRILSIVAYQDRFPAGRLRPPVGVIPGAIRSLHELHLLLAPDDRSLPGINLSALPEWIGSIVGDRVLADSVRSAVAAMPSYVEGCLATYELVGQRVAQARALTGEGEYA